MLNNPRHKDEDARTRRCIVSGARTAPEGLIRFVLDPDGAVVPDLAENLPGRGAWVGADRALIEKAAAKGAFSRAFEQQAAATDLADRVDGLLRMRALSALGLARKAGATVVGFDQVKAFLESGRPGVLITARDAAEDGAAKLARLARNGAAMRLFDSASLSQALGREAVKHAAMRASVETRRLTRDIMRYAAFVGAVAETETLNATH